MAIAFVADRGSTQNLTAQTATTVSVTANTADGNVIIARVAVDNTGASGALPGLTVTDTKGNTWVVLTGGLADPGAASAGIATYIAYTVMATAALVSGNTVTFTFGASSTAKAIVIEEWSGIDTTTPVAVAATTGSSATTASPTMAKTPTATGQLLYVAWGLEIGTTATITGDSDTTAGSWVALTNLSTTSGTAASNARIYGQYKLVTATSAQSWAATSSVTADNAAVAVVFAVGAPTISKSATDTLSISGTETDPSTVDKTALLSNEDFEDASYQFTVNSGDWIRTSAQFHGGGWSLTNLDIGDSGSSEIVIAKPAEALSINFWYRVSSESGWDYFRFLVDGVEIFKASGTVGWTNYIYDVTTATTITFKYTKDSSGSVGEDSAYVDDVSFWGPAGPPPIAVPVSDTASISLTGVATVVQGLTQTLNPDAVLTQTNLTGAVTDIDEDPDSPDASWMTGGGAVVLRVSFPTPTTDLVPGFPQEFRIRARPGT